MNIALVSPRGVLSEDSEFKNILSSNRDVQGYLHSVTYAISQGLLVVAALTPRNMEIDLIDENFETVDFNKRYDLVGISAMTQQITRAYEIADTFRQKGTPVVIGGIHATVVPHEVKEHCDSVFVGEAEDTWPVFLRDLQVGKIRKVYKAASYADLGKSPVPRYDLLKKDYYKVVWMQSSRGCPHDCEFCCCSTIYGYTPRKKSLKQIEEEIRVIQDIWPDARINFSDDNLFSNRRHAAEFVKKIRSLNVRWYAQTDISVAKDDTFLVDLKNAGCTTLFIGFESVSPRNLRELNKNLWKFKQLRTYETAIQKIQEHGIGIIGAFIIGFDNDTATTIEELGDFIIKNKLYMSQIAILTPLPGTRLYERMKVEKRLLGSPWKNYTFTDVNFRPKKMSVEDLRQNFYSIYKRVYDKKVRLSVLREFKDIFKKANTDNKNHGR